MRYGYTMEDAHRAAQRLGRAGLSAREAAQAICAVPYTVGTPTQEEVMDTPATQGLPSPAEVTATLEAMRAAVMERYNAQDDDIAEARSMIESAEQAKAQLREMYPMFFPEPEQPPGRNQGQPSVEQKNQVLRILAEHPGESRKQLARRTSFSPSWAGEIVRALRRQGDFLVVSKRGREQVYSLTELGMSTVNNGGLRA